MPRGAVNFVAVSGVLQPDRLALADDFSECRP
jgi:hypothetical protein